jgi:thiamine transport system permease protein
MVSRLAGAYRMEQADAAALVLVMLSFALFAVFDRGGRYVAP